MNVTIAIIQFAHLLELEIWKHATLNIILSISAYLPRHLLPLRALFHMKTLFNPDLVTFSAAAPPSFVDQMDCVKKNTARNSSDCATFVISLDENPFHINMTTASTTQEHARILRAEKQ